MELAILLTAQISKTLMNFAILLQIFTLSGLIDMFKAKKRKLQNVIIVDILLLKEETFYGTRFKTAFG